MILFPHMLVGAVIGSKINNFWAIFILALISHFLFDRLPHWEYVKNPSNLPREKFPFFIFKAVLDLTLGIIIIWYLTSASLFHFYIFFGAFTAILPDGLTLLNMLTGKKIKILEKFWSFHKKVSIAENKNSPFWGAIIEIAVVILSIYFIREFN